MPRRRAVGGGITYSPRHSSVLQGVFARVCSRPRIRQPLRIPGELLTVTTDNVGLPHLIHQLRRHMTRLSPVPKSRYSCPATFVHKALKDYTHLSATRCIAPFIGPSVQPPPQSLHARTRRSNSLCVERLSQYQHTGLNGHSC